MDALKAGMSGTFEQEVRREDCTSRGGPYVFATPSMVRFAERSSHDLVAAHLLPGQHTVGTVVNIRHLAPTLEGMKVHAEVELVEVDRRRLRYRIRVYDDIELVGECEHERFVIDVDKAGERLARKAQALANRKV